MICHVCVTQINYTLYFILYVLDATEGGCLWLIDSSLIWQPFVFRLTVQSEKVALNEATTEAAWLGYLFIFYCSLLFFSLLLSPQIKLYVVNEIAFSTLDLFPRSMETPIAILIFCHNVTENKYRIRDTKGGLDKRPYSDSQHVVRETGSHFLPSSSIWQHSSWPATQWMSLIYTGFLPGAYCCVRIVQLWKKCIMLPSVSLRGGCNSVKYIL